jgi:hypothetical protein
MRSAFLYNEFARASIWSPTTSQLFGLRLEDVAILAGRRSLPTRGRLICHVLPHHTSGRTGCRSSARRYEPIKKQVWLQVRPVMVPPAGDAHAGRTGQVVSRENAK